MTDELIPTTPPRRTAVRGVVLYLTLGMAVMFGAQVWQAHRAGQSLREPLRAGCLRVAKANWQRIETNRGAARRALIVSQVDPNAMVRKQNASQAERLLTEIATLTPNTAATDDDTRDHVGRITICRRFYPDAKWLP